MSEAQYWRKCGSCKRSIGFSTPYQQCSISSCRKLVYCSVDCWEHHNEIMSHKSAWAEENRSPSQAEEKTGGKRRIIVSSSSSSSNSNSSGIPRDILIVASKLKNYVKVKHDMNTAANVMEKLSDLVRFSVDDAIEKARSEGRKTLMDRDFKN